MLFDEIEKASDALRQLLLGILDKATLTLGDNWRVDLSQTMIFMTSNLGGGEVTELMTGGIGFARSFLAGMKPRLDQKVEKTASQAARRKFAPEFMNRIDKMVVFHPLRNEQLEQILQIELGMVQQRVLETAKGRPLKRAIERHIVYPIANLLATDQVTKENSTQSRKNCFQRGQIPLKDVSRTYEDLSQNGSWICGIYLQKMCL